MLRDPSFGVLERSTPDPERQKKFKPNLKEAQKAVENV
jgi:hypothetical protein